MQVIQQECTCMECLLKPHASSECMTSFVDIC